MASSMGWGAMNFDGGGDEPSPPSRPAATQPPPAASQPAAQPAWALGVVAADTPPASKKGKQKDAGTSGTMTDISLGNSTAEMARLEARVKELEAKERDLLRRENQIQGIQRELEAGGITIKPKNWPRCKPFLYMDISEEVPESNQPCCRAGYACWMMACAAYLFNFLAVSIMFFMGTGSLACWFFAALATVIGLFCSWYFWYDGLYNALQSQGSLWPYGKFFIHMSIFVGWCIWVFIAPPIGSASCWVAGFFVMTDQFGIKSTQGTVGGILSLINLIIWGLTGVMGLYVLVWSYTIWKRGGGEEALAAQASQVAAAGRTFGAMNNPAAQSAARTMFGGAPPQ